MAPGDAALAPALRRAYVDAVRPGHLERSKGNWPHLSFTACTEKPERRISPSHDDFRTVMAKTTHGIPPTQHPKPADYAFDLDRALRSIVALRATVPDDAFTATTLGTERAGSAVHILPGVFLTIGYLITEAETV